MQRTYCDDCGKEIPSEQKILCGAIKLCGVKGESIISVVLRDMANNADPDLCPDCLLSVVKILKECVLSRDKPKPKPEPKAKVEEKPQVNPEQ